MSNFMTVQAADVCGIEQFEYITLNLFTDKILCFNYCITIASGKKIQNLFFT